MRGADALVQTLEAAGVSIVFGNPGTSEMHAVAALDDQPGLRPVLCLFEGGATGAADGWTRMTGEPAAVLLHLGPGFANGWANLHNARKAGSGMVVVTGDHARQHLEFDAPLTSDLDGVARSISDWQRRSEAPGQVGPDTAAAVAAARTGGGRIATLILPSDASWGEGGAAAVPVEPPASLMPDATQIEAAAARLRQPGAALYVGGRALYGDNYDLAAEIAATVGARLMIPVFCPRLRDGAGAPKAERLAYRGADCAALLEGTTEMVTVGARQPVNFFAYPGVPSSPVPPGCTVTELALPNWDIAGTLAALADAVGVSGAPVAPRLSLDLPAAASGPITQETLRDTVLRTIPENAIAVNEGVSDGFQIWMQSGRARAHERLDIMGGSIGQGLPSATGAALACPDRRVLAVVGDGSAMYTLQSLWTMARERLDVTVLILANRGYKILRQEMDAMGAEPGPSAAHLFDVVNPELDFVALAKGHGVTGERVETAEALETALDRSYARPGPHLIEAVMQS